MDYNEQSLAINATASVIAVKISESILKQKYSYFLLELPFDPPKDTLQKYFSTFMRFNPHHQDLLCIGGHLKRQEKKMSFYVVKIKLLN